jgi:hypothetical protein
MAGSRGRVVSPDRARATPDSPISTPVVEVPVVEVFSGVCRLIGPLVSVAWDEMGVDHHERRPHPDDNSRCSHVRVG